MPGMSRHRWGRTGLLVGLALMLIGLADPIEGSLVIAPGTGLAALGAWLLRSARRRPAVLGFLLVAIDVAAMWVLSAFGGVGGSTGRSVWWAVFMVPYPIGWVLSLVTALGVRRESAEPPDRPSA